MESNGGHFMAGRLSAGTTESRGLVPHFLRVPYGEKSMASTSYRILFRHTPKNTHGFIFADYFFLISAAVSLWKNGLSHGLVQGSSSIASNKLNANITALGLS